MRILHLIPSLRKGGAERLVLDIVRQLGKLPETEVALAVMHQVHEYADEYPEIAPRFISSSVIPSLRGKWKVNTSEWEKLIADFKPDVIHTHLFEAEILCHYNPHPGIRYVTHLHDNMRQFRNLKISEIFNKQRITEAYEKRFIVKQYQQSRPYFLAISPDTRTFFQLALPQELHDHILDFPNAIDTQRFSKNSAKAPEDIIQLINVGTFVPKKNQQFLVDVAAVLRNKNVKFEMLLAGEGPLLPAVRQKIHELRLEAFVKTPGRVQNIEKQLGAHQVYVHSAYYEPFGLVLIEGMAAGLPVVCIDGKGNRELIIQGENGYMVDPPNAEIFAEKILACTENTETWNRMSRSASAFASGYDIKNYVDKLMTVYRK